MTGQAEPAKGKRDYAIHMLEIDGDNDRVLTHAATIPAYTPSDALRDADLKDGVYIVIALAAMHQLTRTTKTTTQAVIEGMDSDDE